MLSSLSPGEVSLRTNDHAAVRLLTLRLLRTVSVGHARRHATSEHSVIALLANSEHLGSDACGHAQRSLRLILRSCLLAEVLLQLASGA